MNSNIKYTSVIVPALMLCLSSLFSYAEEAKFTASSSNNTVAVGDQVQVTFQLEGSGKNFTAPNFADFNILMGPSQSTSMQFINGSMSQSISFTYIIQAVKEGVFKIPPASIETAGKKIQSNTIAITVVKGGNNSQQQQGNNQQQQQQGNKSGNNAVQSGGKNVFFKVSVGKSNIYRGENVLVTYKLYTKVTLVNYGLNKMPSLDGFFSQEIQMPQQLEFHVENVDGVQYKVADIKKLVLFPQRTGTLTLDPMEGEVVARMQVKRQQSRDPFDQFFNDPFFNNPFFNNSVQDIPIKLKSDPVKINVRELPDGAPSTFNGAVGKFTMEASLDKKETKSHDAVTLKVKIAGKGNLKLIDPPKIEFPPDFETYDPKVTANVNAAPGGVSGSKTFEYLVIPRNAGEYKFTVGGFTFFDLDNNKYETAPGVDFVLKVDKGDETTTTTVSGVSKSDVQFLGKDIRFIKTNPPVFIQNKGVLYNSPLFYTLCGAPALLFIFLFIFRKRYEEMQSNVTLLKSRRANKVAMKRLSAAKKSLVENNTEKFLDAMFQALWGFVSDRLQIPVSELSKENVSIALAAKNVSTESVTKFNETLDSLELARFAKGIASSNQEIYKKGIDVISKLEEEIA
ncbi:MAG: BatD family protein [Bacteroidota bacterium]